MDMLSVPSGNLPHDVLWYVNLLFSCHFVIFCFFFVFWAAGGACQNGATAVRLVEAADKSNRVIRTIITCLGSPSPASLPRAQRPQLQQLDTSCFSSCLCEKRTQSSSARRRCLLSRRDPSKKEAPCDGGHNSLRPRQRPRPTLACCGGPRRRSSRGLDLTGSCRAQSSCRNLWQLKGT